MKTGEDKRMVKLEIFFFYFNIVLFDIYLKNKSSHSWFGAWSFLLVQIYT